MTRTVYRVFSNVAAEFEAEIAELVQDIENGADFSRITNGTKEEAVKFIKDHPMDVLEPQESLILETPSFLKARRKALRAACADWFGQTSIVEVEIDDTAPVYDRETDVKRWDCHDGDCYGVEV